MDGAGLDAVLDAQCGVVARRQLRDLGAAPHDVKRLLRRRELAAVHPGVYVAHTGRPSWEQLAWAGVLAVWPAALCASSALPDPRRRAEGAVHVAVDRDRRVRGPAGVRVHRLVRLSERVRWNLGPPRLRVEDAVLDVAVAARSDLAAIGVLAEACRERWTTPRRIADVAAERGRLARRSWLRGLLADLEEGTASVLEHGYLTRVERAHGLPRARRQVRARTTAGVVYRDVEYAEGFVVELDGRPGHSTTAERDADFDRDLAAALDGRATARLSWGQVFERPCHTAGAIAELLGRRGWTGALRRCSPACSAPDRGTSGPPGRPDPPRSARSSAEMSGPVDTLGP